MSENSPVEPAGGSPAAGMQERATTSSSGKQGDGNVVSRAAALLRQHTDSGWKAIEDSVITRALTLFRPSAPVRGRHDLGDFFLAADVVVNELRQRIDAVPARRRRRSPAPQVSGTNSNRSPSSSSPPTAHPCWRSPAPCTPSP